MHIGYNFFIKSVSKENLLTLIDHNDQPMGVDI